MAGAFAYYEWVRAGQVQPKYLISRDVTTDDRWDTASAQDRSPARLARH